MAIDSNDYDSPAEGDPRHDLYAQWLPGPLERPIVADDDGWSHGRPGGHEDDGDSEPEECEQDDRRRIIRLGGNGF